MVRALNVPANDKQINKIPLLLTEQAAQRAAVWNESGHEHKGPKSANERCGMGQ